MTASSLALWGCVDIQIRDHTKDIITRHIVKNIVVNVGLDQLAMAMLSGHSQYQGSATVYPRYLAFGTGSTAASASDTSLDSFVAGSLKEFTSISFAPTGKVTMSTFYDTSEGNNGTPYAEIGIYSGVFNGSNETGMTLIARQVLSPTVLKQNTFSMNIDWTFVLSYQG